MKFTLTPTERTGSTNRILLLALGAMALGILSLGFLGLWPSNPEPEDSRSSERKEQQPGIDRSNSPRPVLPPASRFGGPEPIPWDHEKLKVGFSKIFRGFHDYSERVLELRYVKGEGYTLFRDVKLEAGSGAHFAGYTDQSTVDSMPWVYVLGGHSRGSLDHGGVFRGDWQVEFEMEYQLLLGKDPFFEIVFTSVEDSRSYGTRFGSDLRVYDSGRLTHRLPPSRPERDAHPRDWITRYETYHVALRHRENGSDSKGFLGVYLNGELSAQLEPSRFRKGRIGFRWKDVKFYTTDIAIRGRVDRSWAEDTIDRGLLFPER